MTIQGANTDPATRMPRNGPFVVLMAAGLSIMTAGCGESPAPQPDFSTHDVATFSVDCPSETEPMIGSSELTSPEDLPNGDSLSIACYREVGDEAGSIISKPPVRIVFEGLRHIKKTQRDPRIIQVPYDRNQFDPKKPVHVVTKKGPISTYVKLFGNK